MKRKPRGPAVDATGVIEEHYPQLLRSAMLLTGNRAAAEDLTQEAFLRALGSWHRFQGKSSRKTWLYGILLNVHRSNQRGNCRRWERILRWFDGSSKSTVTPSATEEVFRREWKASLWRIVSQLPAGQQEVIVLRFSEEMSYAEIAETLGCPIGTVKSRINTALKRLSQNPIFQDQESLTLQG